MKWSSTKSETAILSCKATIQLRVRNDYRTLLDKINITIVQIDDVIFHRTDLEKENFQNYIPMERKILAEYAEESHVSGPPSTLEILCDIIRVYPASIITATCSRTIAEAMSTVQIWKYSRYPIRQA